MLGGDWKADWGWKHMDGVGGGMAPSVAAHVCFFIMLRELSLLVFEQSAAVRVQSLIVIF